MLCSSNVCSIIELYFINIRRRTKPPLVVILNCNAGLRVACAHVGTVHPKCYHSYPYGTYNFSIGTHLAEKSSKATRRLVLFLSSFTSGMGSLFTNTFSIGHAARAFGNRNNIVLTFYTAANSFALFAIQARGS